MEGHRDHWVGGRSSVSACPTAWGGDGGKPRVAKGVSRKLLYPQWKALDSDLQQATAPRGAKAEERGHVRRDATRTREGPAFDPGML